MSEVFLDELVELITDKIFTNKDPKARYIGLEHIAQGEPRLLGFASGTSSVSVNAVFKKDDILFGKLRPNLKKSLKAPFDGYCSTDILVLRSCGAVLPSFAGHIFQWDRVFYAAVSTAAGTKMPRTSWRDLRHFGVLKPAMEAEQSRIAYVLDTIDDAIQKSEAVINKLKRVREGMLHDLLTYGLDEDGRLRNSVVHPEQFKDSELGRIPKEWDVKRLSSLCEHIGSGITPRGGQDVYTNKGIMFIRSQNVAFKGLLLEGVAYIPEVIHLGMQRSEVFAHDVLFNITGASIGRCCAMPAGLGRVNVNQHVCILRVPDANHSDAVFLACFMASYAGQTQMDALNTCGNRQGLNYQQLGSFFAPWPQENERSLIAEKIERIKARIDSEISEKMKHQDMKSGLMGDLLSGDKPVPDDLLPKEGNA